MDQYIDFEKYLYPKAYLLLELLGNSKPKPEYPFWRMQNDDIWEIKLLSSVTENSSGDVSKKQLFAAKAKGGLCFPLYNQAKNLSSEKYIVIVNNIVDNHIDANVQIKQNIINYLLKLETKA